MVIRSTPDGVFVWFQLGADSHRKITWTLELFLAYAKTSPSDTEARLSLFEGGEITLLTESDLMELEAARPFEKTKIEWERTKHLPINGGGNRNGGLPLPELSKAART